MSQREFLLARYHTIQCDHLLRPEVIGVHGPHHIQGPASPYTQALRHPHCFWATYALTSSLFPPPLSEVSCSPPFQPKKSACHQPADITSLPSKHVQSKPDSGRSEDRASSGEQQSQQSFQVQIPQSDSEVLSFVTP